MVSDRARSIKREVDELETILEDFFPYMDDGEDRHPEVNWAPLDRGAAALIDHIRELKREYYLAIEEVPACSS